MRSSEAVTLKVAGPSVVAIIGFGADHDRDRPTRALLSAIFQGKLVPHEIDLLPPVSLPPSPHFSFLPVPGSLSSRVFA